jgi:hypothetical protein
MVPSNPCFPYLEELLKQLTDFHETWYDHSTGGYTTSYFLISIKICDGNDINDITESLQ